ncbi:MAG: metallophosphoesterase [Myxococcales bacterium]
MSTAPHRLDIVGDVHGQLQALRALGRHLGYRVDDGWTHPDGRTLVFLGDLTDRGPDSLGVAKLVFGLADAGRAFCLMGNHEFNLVGWALGQMKVKSSNRDTCEAVLADRLSWQPILDRMRELPMAVDLPELRLVHAVWHQTAFDAVKEPLAPRGLRPKGSLTTHWLHRHVALESPWDHHGLREGISRSHFQDQRDPAQELLLKGYEVETPTKFRDRDGKVRDRARVTWWDLENPPVPADKLTVFGHYWNLPPMPGLHDAFAPPHPPGTDPLRDWQRRNASSAPRAGNLQVSEHVKFVCVDYSGVPDGNAGSCVGAFRWPERQVSWVRLPEADVGLLGQVE